jgi:tRNA threonylcarbamoyladenosine biosynthesis protein TsaB
MKTRGALFMKILAVEFSSAERSVALVESDPPRTVCLGLAVEKGGLKTRTVALVEEALGRAGIEREAVACLAVGLGPGSYTGIRLAIALAQGWQLARGIRLLGLSSTLALARQAQIEGHRGTIRVVVDAQRQEFYLAGYDLNESFPRQLAPLRIVSRETVLQCLEAGETVVGPEVTRHFSGGNDLWPSAAGLGELAAGQTEFVAGETLEPIYLRPVEFVKAPPPRVF